MHVLYSVEQLLEEGARNALWKDLAEREKLVKVTIGCELSHQVGLALREHVLVLTQNPCERPPGEAAEESRVLEGLCYRDFSFDLLERHELEDFKRAERAGLGVVSEEHGAKAAFAHDGEQQVAVKGFKAARLG